MHSEPPSSEQPLIAPEPPQPAGTTGGAPVRRNRVLVTVGSVVTVGLLGLGAAAVAFGSGGASTPEEAVEHLASAIDAQDVLAAVATLAPDETRSLPDLVGRITSKSKELDLPGRFDRAWGRSDDDGDGDNEAADRGPFGGADLKVTGLQLSTQQLSDDVAKVEVTGGKLTWDLPEGSNLSYTPGFGFLSPFGLLTDIGLGGASRYGTFDEEMCSYLDDVERPSGSTVAPADEATDDTFVESTDEDFEPQTRAECEAEVAEMRESSRHGEIDFGELHRKASASRPGVFVMTVNRDGGWYVSPFFTAAEYARLDTDSPAIADYDTDPGPAAATPSKALTALADAAGTGDSAQIANVLASELSVWRVYGRSIAEGDSGDLLEDVTSIEVSDLTTHEEEIDDDRVRIVVDSARIEYTTSEIDWDAYDLSDESYLDDVEETPRIDVRHTTTIEGDCVTDTRTPADGETGETQCLSTLEGGIVRALGVDHVSMVAVADRDGWAISPIESIADYLRTAVDHMTGPLLDRLLGSWGSEDREPSARLREGDNEVRLDDAGMATVSLDVDRATFATLATSDDEGDTGISLDGYGYYGRSSIDAVGPGRHVVSVTGPIGTASVTVNVRVAEAESLSATTADGGRSAPVTGTLQPGEIRVFSVASADYDLLVTDTGYDLTSETYDADGEYVSSYDDEYLYDEDDPTSSEEPPELPDTIFVVISGDADPEGQQPGSDAFSLSFLPASGGFAGADPSTATALSESDELDGTVQLSVVAGQAFDLTIEAPSEVTARIECPSAQFEDPSASGLSFPGTTVEPSGVDGAGMSFSDVVGADPEDASGMSFGSGLDDLVAQAGYPAGIWLSPTVTEVCIINLMTPYWVGYYGSDDWDETLSRDSVPVTLRMVPTPR